MPSSVTRAGATTPSYRLVPHRSQGSKGRGNSVEGGRKAFTCFCLIAVECGVVHTCIHIPVKLVGMPCTRDHKYFEEGGT